MLVRELIVALGKCQETNKYILWKNVELQLVTLLIYIYTLTIGLYDIRVCGGKYYVVLIVNNTTSWFICTT
jgi:hypothetical protein